MSNLTIFQNAGSLAKAPSRGLSDLAKSVATPSTTRRIQTNTNGTFRRLVGGEQIGKAIRGEFNAIIVGMLPKVSRTYYEGAYDPDAKATLPDCWSNLGDKPEASAGNKQSNNCATCPMNVDGSGTNGKGKACRFQRRVALLIEGDASGDVYQFNIPAKSLFGKGSGNTHPFESYVRYLAANEHSIDYVVTNVAYNLDADSMELQFTPVRPISDEEYELVVAAQADPETQRLVQLTVAEADGATKKAAPAPKAAQPEEDDEEEAPKPAKRQRRVEPEDEEEAPVEPVKRSSKPSAEKPKVNDLSSLVDSWLDEDEDD